MTAFISRRELPRRERAEGLLEERESDGARRMRPRKAVEWRLAAFAGRRQMHQRVLSEETVHILRWVRGVLPHRSGRRRGREECALFPR